VRSGAGLHFDVNITSHGLQRELRHGDLHPRRACSSVAATRKGSPVNLLPGRNVIGIDLAQIPLLDGIYDVNVGVVDPAATP
jgi:hypothetical protein